MKFGAVFCIYDDHEYLEISLESIKDKLDKVLFLISDIPWNGQKSDNSSTIEKVKELCKNNKNFELIQSHWTNEIDQRNFGLSNFYNEKIDYCFIIDSDEIYHSFHFDNIKQFIKQNPQVSAFHIEWNTYWSKQYYVIAPRESYQPVIAVKVDSFQFYTIRHGTTSISRAGTFIFKTQQTKYNGVLIPSKIAICYHLSYSRSDSYIKRKLETNSHASEFIKDWYEKVWLKWTPDNKNLHPVTPQQYNKAIKENFLVFPDSLKKFIKKERSENVCSIIILNWNSFDLLIRCLELIKKNTKRKHEIIIVDNGSKDFDESIFQQQKIIKNKENLGFAAGVNQGIEISEKNSDICLINVDAEPQENWLDNMYETLINNPRAGIVGPLGNQNGYQEIGMVDKDMKVCNIHFYCGLISREVINRIGLLDTRFGVGGYEDNDFCIRANLSGYENWISSKSLVIHKPHQVFELNGLNRYEIEVKNKEILRNKLIQAFYEYGKMIDLFSFDEIAKKSGLIC